MQTVNILNIEIQVYLMICQHKHRQVIRKNYVNFV